MDIINMNRAFSSRYGHFMMLDSVKILFLSCFFNFGRMIMFSRPWTDVILRPFTVRHHQSTCAAERFVRARFGFKPMCPESQVLTFVAQWQQAWTLRGCLCACMSVRMNLIKMLNCWCLCPFNFRLIVNNKKQSCKQAVDSFSHGIICSCGGLFFGDPIFAATLGCGEHLFPN